MPSSRHSHENVSPWVFRIDAFKIAIFKRIFLPICGNPSGNSNVSLRSSTGQLHVKVTTKSSRQFAGDYDYGGVGGLICWVVCFQVQGGLQRPKGPESVNCSKGLNVTLALNGQRSLNCPEVLNGPVSLKYPKDIGPKWPIGSNLYRGPKWLKWTKWPKAPTWPRGPKYPIGS
ncbi:hypothetical protein L798_04750 [Zootermopsis nevadensis]|uniref:Uncharacterized protein n=1 Tax=Zootermopsis nevadensis TaxID=136037 RepID=A0A067RMC2_ZOONE|nr:hypothetical protein L798_04750 [Zootermopsis nevadensis]